jgi:GST-like protein
MITLYTHGTPNGHKVAIALEELALPYEIRMVEVFAGAGQTPEFLAKNPLGKIPVIEDSDTGAVVFESNAILQYLADQTGQLWTSDRALRLRAIQLLYVQASLQGPMFGQRAWFAMFGPEHVPAAIRRYEQQGDTIDAIMERLLSEGPYLLGSAYSIVDIAFFGWYYAANRSGYNERWGDRLRAWYARIDDRPAVKRGVMSPPGVPLPQRRHAA